MISLRNLRVSYGEREILHGIDFDVMRGETMVILGGSGSGKSTLLRTLVGLERPNSGEIWLRGRTLASISGREMDEIRKKIGMSFQGSALFGSMTVGENVALPLREHTKLENSTIEIILRLKLDQVGLAGFNYRAGHGPVMAPSCIWMAGTRPAGKARIGAGSGSFGEAIAAGRR